MEGKLSLFRDIQLKFPSFFNEKMPKKLSFEVEKWRKKRCIPIYIWRTRVITITTSGPVTMRTQLAIKWISPA